MNLVDKISKDLLALNAFIKDSVKVVLIESAQKGQITVNEEGLKNLLFLVESSIDNSVQKALSNFQRSVGTHLNTYKEEILRNSTRK